MLQIIGIWIHLWNLLFCYVPSWWGVIVVMATHHLELDFGVVLLLTYEIWMHLKLVTFVKSAIYVCCLGTVYLYLLDYIFIMLFLWHLNQFMKLLFHSHFRKSLYCGNKDSMKSINLVVMHHLYHLLNVYPIWWTSYNHSNFCKSL